MWHTRIWPWFRQWQIFFFIWLWKVKHRWFMWSQYTAESCWSGSGVRRQKIRSRKVCVEVEGVLGQGTHLSSLFAWPIPSGRQQRVTDILVSLWTVLGIQQIFKPHTLWGISVICVTWVKTIVLLSFTVVPTGKGDWKKLCVAWNQNVLYVSSCRWLLVVPWYVNVRQGLHPVLQGSAQFQMPVAAARCVLLSSTRIVMKGDPVTTIKAWSATMAMMWDVPMASAGVCT